MKVILDTNLWISFLIGHQTQLLRLILTDLRFDVYVCNQLIAEIRDVTSRPKVRKYITPSEVEDLFAIIHAFCKYASIETEVTSSSVRDPKDLYLLALAETINATYIVSGDADLTELIQHKQTQILKLADFKKLMSYS